MVEELRDLALPEEFDEEAERQLGMTSAQVILESEKEHPVSLCAPTDCLLPYEIDLLKSGQELHQKRSEHLAACAYCKAIVQQEPQPAYVDALLSRLQSTKVACDLERWLQMEDWSPRYFKTLDSREVLSTFEDFVRQQYREGRDQKLLRRLADRLARLVLEHPGFDIASSKAEWLSEPALTENVLRIAGILPKSEALFGALAGSLEKAGSTDFSLRPILLNALAAQQTDARLADLWTNILKGNGQGALDGDVWQAYRAMLRIPARDSAVPAPDWHLVGQALGLLALAIQRTLSRKKWRSKFHCALKEAHGFGLREYWFDGPTGHVADLYDWPRWAVQCLSVATQRNVLWKPLADVFRAARPTVRFWTLCGGELVRFESTQDLSEIFHKLALQLESNRDTWEVCDPAGTNVQALSVLEEVTSQELAFDELRDPVRQVSRERFSELALT